MWVSFLGAAARRIKVPSALSSWKTEFIGVWHTGRILSHQKFLRDSLWDTKSHRKPHTDPQILLMHTQGPSKSLLAPVNPQFRPGSEQAQKAGGIQKCCKKLSTAWQETLLSGSKQVAPCSVYPKAGSEAKSSFWNICLLKVQFTQEWHSQIHWTKGLRFKGGRWARSVN